MKILIISQWLFLILGVISVIVFIWYYKRFQRIIREEQPDFNKYDVVDANNAEQYYEDSETYFSKLTNCKRIQDISFWFSMICNTTSFILSMIEIFKNK